MILNMNIQHSLCMFIVFDDSDTKKSDVLHINSHEISLHSSKHVKIAIQTKIISSLHFCCISVRFTDAHIIFSEHEMTVSVSHHLISSNVSYWLYFQLMFSHFSESTLQLTKSLFLDFTITAVSVVNLRSAETKISICKILKHIIFLSDSEIIIHFSKSIHSNVISMHSSNISSKSDFISNESSSNSDLTISWNLSFQINYDSLSTHFNSDISDHWDSEYRQAILQLLKNWYQLFQSDLDRMHSAYMLILFQNENDIKKLKQSSYHIFICDQVEMNKILNDFVDQDWVQSVSLDNLSSAVFLMFVIWKNDKSKIIMNFHHINAKLWSDAYFLSQQDIILSAFDDNMIFSSLNIIKKFFQVSIESLDCWKTVFVTSHQEYK